MLIAEEIRKHGGPRGRRAVAANANPVATQNGGGPDAVGDVARRLTAYIPVEFVTVFTFSHSAICSTAYQTNLSVHTAVYLMIGVLIVIYAQVVRVVEARAAGAAASWLGPIDRKTVGIILIALVSYLFWGALVLSALLDPGVVLFATIGAAVWLSALAPIIARSFDIEVKS
jgi:hypothetical protein